MRTFSILAASVFLSAPAMAGSATWNSTSSGNWSTGGRWNTGSAPGSTTVTNSTDAATFNNTTAVTVNVDLPNQNIGSILFTGTYGAANTYSGNPLLLSSGGQINNGILAQYTQSFSLPLILQAASATSNGAYTFTTSNGSAGSLSFSGPISGATTTGNITLNLGTNTFASTISGAISNGTAAGGVAVAQSGGGKWTLAGANTYSGGTTISGGSTLTLQGSLKSTGSVTLKGGNLTYSPPSSVTTQTLGGLTIGTGTSVLTSSQNTMSVGAITHQAGGVLVLTPPSNISTTTTNTNGILGPWAVVGNSSSNLYYATVSGSALTYYFGATAATNATLANMTSATTNYSYSTGTNVVLAGNVTGHTLSISSANINTTGYSMTLNGLLSSSGVGSTITGSGPLIIGASNELDIVTGNTDVSIAAPITGNGALLFSSVGGSFNGKLTLSGANTYLGGTYINNSQVTLSGAGTLGSTTAKLTMSGGRLDLNGTVQTVANVDGGGGTIYNDATGTTSLFFVGNGNASGTLTPLIKDNSGTGGVISLVKIGSGKLVMENTFNSYTGGTTVNAGVLVLQSAGVFGTNGTVTVAPGSTLQIQGDITGGSKTFNLGGSGASGTSGALENLSGNNGYQGPIVLTSSTRIVVDAGSLSLTGGITGAGAVLSLGGAGDGAIANDVAVGSLYKNGAGQWMLTNGKSYAGSTTIDGGTISINSLANGGLASGIGSSGSGAENLIFGGGTLRYTGGIGQTNRLFTIGDANGYTATLDASGFGAGTMSFTNTGAIVMANAVPHGLTLTGTNTGANTFMPVIGDENLYSPTSLTKTGPGNWVLAGANTFTGGTTISAGTLQVGVNLSAGASALGSPSNSLVNNGVLDLNGHDQAVGALAGTGTILNSANGTAKVIAVGNGNASSTFSGVIKDNAGSGATGTVGLYKGGNGTIVLTGANTYTGSTTVDGGILQVDGSITSTTTVNPGGQLRGTGQFGRVVMSSGSTLMVGDSTTALSQTATAQSLVFNPYAMLQFKLDSSLAQSDTLNVAGALTLNNTLLFLNDLAGTSHVLTPGTQLTLLVYNYGMATGIGTGSDVFVFNGTALTQGKIFTYGANTFQIDYAFGDPSVVLTSVQAVPEPSEWVLLAGSLTALALLRRRSLSSRN